MPAATLRPAPVRNTTLVYFLFLRFSMSSLQDFSCQFLFYYQVFYQLLAYSSTFNFSSSSCSKASSLFYSWSCLGSSLCSYLAAAVANLDLENYLLARISEGWSIQLSQSQHQNEPSEKLKVMACLVSSLCFAMWLCTQREQPIWWHCMQIQFYDLSLHSWHSNQEKCLTLVLSRNSLRPCTQFGFRCGQSSLGRTANPFFSSAILKMIQILQECYRFIQRQTVHF